MAAAPVAVLWLEQPGLFVRIWQRCGCLGRRLLVDWRRGAGLHIPRDAENQEALRSLVLIPDVERGFAFGIDQLEPLLLDPCEVVVGV